MVDKTRAYEISEGLVLNRNGSELAFVTSGSSAPTGLDLPDTTIYLQTTGNGIIYWRKFGAGVNDWRQLSAQDIPFDVTGLTTENPDFTGLTQVQETIAAVANRGFSKDNASIETNTPASTTVQLPTTTIYHTLNLNVTEQSGINKYRIQSFLQWNYSKTNSQFHAGIHFNGSSIKQMDMTPTDKGINENAPALLMAEVENLAPGSHTITLEFATTGGGAVATINDALTEVWRIA